jgi:diaminopimelate decarboxylase
MTGVASQFGADTSWVLEAPERFAGRDHVVLHGLHLYMGTNLDSVDALAAQFRRSLRTAVRLTAVLREHGADIRVLDLGGGFGAPFAKAGKAIEPAGLRTALEPMFDQELPGWRTGSPEIVFESGRYLVGTAGTLLTTVLDVKRSHGKDVVVLDSGINHLGGMSGLRRLPPLVPHLVSERAEAENGRLDAAMVTGPLCTPLDLWSRTAQLPRVRPGDVLAVPNVGAYGLYASLVAFLGHPLPVEVVIDRESPDQPPRRTRLCFTRVPATDAKE